MHAILVSAGAGYLLGSIPFGYLLVRAFRKADIRATGSGNIGATNVARTSPLLGVATLLLDALKGMCAVWLAFAMFPGNRTIAFLAAFAAVCGHIFPVWLGFRGGKGVATGLGSFLLLTPMAIVLTVGIFVVMAAVFRYVALASIIAAGSLPLLAMLLKKGESPTAISLLAAAALLIVVKHHSNIRRMLNGTEPKLLD